MLLPARSCQPSTYQQCAMAADSSAPGTSTWHASSWRDEAVQLTYLSQDQLLQVYTHLSQQADDGVPSPCLRRLRRATLNRALESLACRCLQTLHTALHGFTVAAWHHRNPEQPAQLTLVPILSSDEKPITVLESGDLMLHVACSEGSMEISSSCLDTAIALSMQTLHEAKWLHEQKQIVINITPDLLQRAQIIRDHILTRPTRMLACYEHHDGGDGFGSSPHKHKERVIKSPKKHRAGFNSPEKHREMDVDIAVAGVDQGQQGPGMDGSDWRRGAGVWRAPEGVRRARGRRGGRTYSPLRPGAPPRAVSAPREGLIQQLHSAKEQEQQDGANLQWMDVDVVRPPSPPRDPRQHVEASVRHRVGADRPAQSASDATFGDWMQQDVQVPRQQPGAGALRDHTQRLGRPQVRAQKGHAVGQSLQSQHEAQELQQRARAEMQAQAQLQEAGPSSSLDQHVPDRQQSAGGSEQQAAAAVQQHKSASGLRFSGPGLQPQVPPSCLPRSVSQLQATLPCRCPLGYKAPSLRPFKVAEVNIVFDHGNHSFKACVHAFPSNLQALNEAAGTPRSKRWESKNNMHLVGFDQLHNKELKLLTEINKSQLDEVVPIGHFLQYSGQIEYITQLDMTPGNVVQQYCKILEHSGTTNPALGVPCGRGEDIQMVHPTQGSIALKVIVFSSQSPYVESLLGELPRHAQVQVQAGQALLALIRAKHVLPGQQPQQ